MSCFCVNSYQYDNVGNRTYSIEDGVHTAYTYDNNDRLLTSGGETYTYDDNGSLLTTTIDNRVTTNTYDARNKLTNVTITDNGSQISQVSYQYDIDGLRTQKNDNNTVTNFVVDKNMDFAQVIHETNNQHQTQVTYTHGDDLISQDRSATINYYHYDGLGSTRSLTDNTGQITDTYLYSAYGATLDHVGNTENDYLFTGEQFDAALGNYYLRARYYDPNNGRFTQMDTFLGFENDPVTLHKYAYANLDPANNIDPSGNFSLTQLTVGGTISGILTTISVVDTGYSLFKLATGEEELTAKDVGVLVLIGLTKGAFGKIGKLAARKCANSFEEGTLVNTQNGIVPIENTKIGDLVWSYNEEKRISELQTVTHKISRENTYSIVTITLESGEKIKSTDNHLFYVDKLGWVNASNLEKDQKLVSRDANSIVISEVQIVRERISVVNLSVNNTHNYYIGNTGVLSHNANCDLSNLFRAREVAKKAFAKFIRTKPAKSAIEKHGFARYLCVECSESFVRAFRNAGIKGKVIGIKSKPNVKGRNDRIYSDKQGKDVSLNGYHEAVEVDGYVFDNLNPDGIPKNLWIQQFHNQGGYFSVFDVKNF